MHLESKLNDLFMFVCDNLVKCFVISSVLCEIIGTKEVQMRKLK